MLAVRELISRHSGDTIVVVGHAVVNRLILLAAMDLPTERYWRVRQENCAIHIIETEMENFTVVSFNDTCHLRNIE